MSKAKRVTKNAGVMFLGNNLLKVMTMFLMIIIARYLGDVEYGKFVFALSFTGLFFIAMDLGTRVLLVREIAKNKRQAGKIVSNVLILKGFSSLIVYGCVILIVNLLGYSPQTTKAVAIAALGLIFDSLSQSMAAVFQAYERLEFPVLTKLFRILIRFLFTVPFLMGGYGFLTVLWIYAGVHIMNFLISAYFCYSKFIPFIVDLDKNFIKGLVKRAFPFLLSGIFVSIYFNIDVTMMSKLAPTHIPGLYEGSRDAIIGWYGVAYTLLEVVISLAAAVSAAILPVAILYHQKSRAKLVQLYETAVRFLTYASIPIVVGTVILADRFIHLLFGAEFGNASLALQILIWTIIPLYTNYILGTLMIAAHKEKEGVIILFLNVVVNIILNIFLIPAWGLYGAAASTVLTEIFYMCGYYFIISKHVHTLNILKPMIKPLIASVVMGTTLFFFMDLNLFFLVVGGMTVYAASMWMLGGIKREDVQLFRSIIKKKV